MKSKKVISLLLMTALTASLLAGCGGSGDSGNAESSASEKEESSQDPEESGSGEAPEESSEEAPEESEAGDDSSAGGEAKYPRDENGYPDLGGETISIWFAMTTENAGAVSTDMGDYEAVKALEEKFNVNFEFIHPPVGQESENFNIMMSDEKLPDMIFCRGIDRFYPGGVEMAYADGVLYDYTDDINAVDTPNFYNMINGDPYLMKAVTDDEGRIIRLGAKICGSEEADLNFIGPLIRSDYLAAANMEVPKTIDDWTAMLQAMKDNGVEYPLALDKSQLIYTSNIFAGAYGVSGNSYFLKEDGSVAFGPYEDAYKDFLTQMHEWYEAGFINPDFASQDTDSIMSMAAGDRIGSTLIHLYTYGVTYFVTTEGDDPDKVMVAAPMPVLNEGDTRNLRSSSRSLGDYKYITADAENKDACIALLDALYLEDIDLMMANGIEGVGYTMEDGAPVQAALSADASKEVRLGSCPQQWHAYEDTDLNYILTKKYNKGCQDEALELWKTEGTSGSISNFIMYNTEESETRSTYNSDVSTAVEEWVMKFITGQEPIDKFDEFREILKNEGHIEELIAIEQSAMDRYDAR